jgi:hypothetical protein
MNNKMQQKRKQTLQQTIDQVYARHRPGRFATRRQRINTMRQVVHDLSHIHSLPSHWSELTAVQITQLVAYWQQRLHPTTIMKRLAVLRHFNQQLHLQWHIPDNAYYGLHSPRATPAPNIQVQTLLDNITHPIIKCTVGLECLLGLTRQEAWQLRPALHGLTPGILHITRDIALHGKERYVPILTQEQQHCWQSLLSLLPNTQSSLSKHWPYHVLQPLYQAHLLAAGVSSRIRLRGYYPRWRQKQLVYLSITEQHRLLCQETGLSPSRIWYYLNEQAKVK